MRLNVNSFEIIQHSCFPARKPFNDARKERYNRFSHKKTLNWRLSKPLCAVTHMYLSSVFSYLSEGLKI